MNRIIAGEEKMRSCSNTVFGGGDLCRQETCLGFKKRYVQRRAQNPDTEVFVTDESLGSAYARCRVWVHMGSPRFLWCSIRKLLSSLMCSEAELARVYNVLFIWKALTGKGPKGGCTAVYGGNKGGGR